MHTHGRSVKGHIKDTERDKKQDSYQTTGGRQNMRQTPEKNTHNYTRDDLGYSDRDTRGYDKHHKGNY
ncbi:hypothetical protein AZI87_01945 [Bdellovibrio bacteriovorus]|uniref:Uncharacterized protein n=1 Tax=Bdellovibrio bacteriovorus TaxID=959 RepID=A0A162GFW9_BDEBC|nr:hypothetical protein [Bdellovibrio bacteriovorus]KYG68050.1 hypothetical protein AZI87_01945 [Bdellovibrio bacteriovorus]